MTAAERFEQIYKKAPIRTTSKWALFIVSGGEIIPTSPSPHLPE